MQLLILSNLIKFLIFLVSKIASKKKDNDLINFNSKKGILEKYPFKGLWE